MTKKRMKYLEKNAQKIEERTKYKSYFVKILNHRTKQTQIVSRDKSFEMINGKADAFGVRNLVLKDTYMEVK